MRKMLLLTALISLSLSGSGCRWCDNLFRGARADQNACPPIIAAPVATTPCAPQACDPCAQPMLPGPGQ